MHSNQISFYQQPQTFNLKNVKSLCNLAQNSVKNHLHKRTNVNPTHKTQQKPENLNSSGTETKNLSQKHESPLVEI